MRAATFLAAARKLPLAPLERIIGAGGVVVVAPHPDDESLGCGGLVALARAQGRPVRIVVVTDGCGSHPNSRNHPPARLRALREAETLEAAAALGLSRAAVAFLRLPDTKAPRRGAAAEQAARRIEACARRIGATALLVTWGFDPHCDHQAAFAIAAAAAKRLRGVALLAYPIWGFSLADDAAVGVAPRGFRLDVTASFWRKRRAIAAHRSQTTAMVDNDPPVVILPPDTLARFHKPFETFFTVAA
ncbi:PIG-L deacetylase family protein [Methylocella sp.]|uniref:PIG-L deacetylase family protein n=1 Tax=Methylocella sp. TaxID=1978226 RepID=UPI0035B39A03